MKTKTPTEAVEELVDEIRSMMSFSFQEERVLFEKIKQVVQDQRNVGKIEENERIVKEIINFSPRDRQDIIELAEIIKREENLTGVRIGS